MSNKQLLHDISVLIIDGDLVSGRRMEMVLSRHGASVRLVADGYQMVDACSHYKPDVIFIELHHIGQNGFELIEQLSNGPWACIAMSSRSDLDDIRKSLRFGACDFLLKPINDFDLLVDVILTNLQQLPQVEEDFQRAQLQEHFEFLKCNDLAASQLLAQMLPESGLKVGNYFCMYQLKGNTILPLVDVLDEFHTVVAIIDFGLLGNEVSVAAVILHSLLQEAWSLYRNEGDLLAIQPALMMQQLNEMVIAADLRHPIGMVYTVISPTTIKAVNAGILDLHSQFKHTEFGLGLVNEARYSAQKMEMDDRGFHLSMSNQSGDRLTLKLSPLNDY
ncbi:MAG: Regulator of RpoS [Candidatus Celerinatantimonas neptuna]|nr:MAG: Regulator of RpoS [Candidatus Celerinatantimonas neptuna]